MYIDILYTLSPPETGRCLQGISRDSDQLVVTCPLLSVVLVEIQQGRPVFECVTRHGSRYLVTVLPPEVDLGGRDLRMYRDVLIRQPGNGSTSCRRPECRCMREDSSRSEQPDSIRQLRILLITLGLMSVVLGSQSVFAEKLWTVLLEIVKILLQP